MLKGFKNSLASPVICVLKLLYFINYLHIFSLWTFGPNPGQSQSHCLAISISISKTIYIYWHF